MLLLVVVVVAGCGAVGVMGGLAWLITSDRAGAEVQPPPVQVEVVPDLELPELEEGLPEASSPSSAPEPLPEATAAPVPTPSAEDEPDPTPAAAPPTLTVRPRHPGSGLMLGQSAKFGVGVEGGGTDCSARLYLKQSDGQWIFQRMKASTNGSYEARVKLRTDLGQPLSYFMQVRCPDARATTGSRNSPHTLEWL